MKCSKCGNALKKNDKFCPNCGTKTTKTTETVPVKSKGTAVASMVIGIISIALGLFLLLPLPIIGLILGLTHKDKCGEKTAGIILNSISIMISVIVYAIFIILIGILVNKTVEYVDDHIDDYVEVETAWDSYDYLKTQGQGRLLNVEGKWRILDGLNSYYYEIDDENFAFYKSIYNSKDNYFKGTYVIEEGKECTKLHNIDSNVMEGYNVLDENTYCVTFNIDTVMEKGEINEEKEQTTNTQVWGLVKHPDGVEAVVYDSETTDTNHYFKLADKSNE